MAALSPTEVSPVASSVPPVITPVVVIADAPLFMVPNPDSIEPAVNAPVDVIFVSVSVICPLDIPNASESKDAIPLLLFVASSAEYVIVLEPSSTAMSSPSPATRTPPPRLSLTASR